MNVFAYGIQGFIFSFMDDRTLHRIKIALANASVNLPRKCNEENDALQLHERSRMLPQLCNTVLQPTQFPAIRPSFPLGKQIVVSSGTQGEGKSVRSL